MTASDCLGYAVEIQRRSEPRDWPRALEGVPVECQEACEEYLRGIAQRIRVIRGLKHARIGSSALDQR